MCWHGEIYFICTLFLDDLLNLPTEIEVLKLNLPSLNVIFLTFVFSACKHVPHLCPCPFNDIDSLLTDCFKRSVCFRFSLFIDVKISCYRFCSIWLRLLYLLINSLFLTLSRIFSRFLCCSFSYSLKN
jgi:hypothetical protein